MKSAINIWTYAAAFALLGTACDNSEYDLQTLVPDNYHAVINVQDDVDEAARIFDTGRSENINFTILRGGSDSSIAIEAQAVTMTQEALSQLGSDYVLLPSECYSLDGAISIPAGKGSDKITVSFSAEQLKTIREMNEALSAPKVYCLALNLVSENAAVFGDKGYIVRRLDVILPQLGFAEAGVLTRKLYDAKQTINLDLTVVRGESDTELPVETKLASMTEEELAAVNPGYLLIPSEQYSLSASDIVLPAGETQSAISVTFSGDQISAIRTMAEAANKQACLALKLQSETTETIAGKGTVLYAMDITQPILQLEYVSGASTPYWEKEWYKPIPLRWTDYKTPRADCWGNGVTFRLKMPEGVANTWTIRCKPAYEPSYIDTYNAIEIPDIVLGNKQLWEKQKTPYQPLPAANDITFYDANGNQVDEIVMKPGQNEITFSYKRRSDNWSFNGAGLYLCPIVATTDLFLVDRQTDPYYLLFYDEVTLGDKTLWEPSVAQQGQLSNLYDGILDQIWHTPWDAGDYIDTTYGQYFQINIKKYQPSHGLHIGLWPRSDDNNANNEGCSPRRVKVFYTSDQVPDPSGDIAKDREVYDALTWVEAADMRCDATCGLLWLSPAIDLKGNTANAIRICTLTKGDHNGNEWSCTEANPDGMKQYVALGEFKIWGN